MMLDTVNIWQTLIHTNRTASWQTMVCSECTLIWKQPQLSATSAGSVLCAQLGHVTCELLGGHSVSMETVSMVTGHLLVTDNGLAKGTTGHVSELEWAWVWGRLALLIFLFSLKSENNTEIDAQVCKCDWTSCNMLEMQQVCPDETCVSWRMMNRCEQNGIWRLKKKSILFVLPDILMFNMRVLYYHDDYDYSCAIIVYCCLNVTLFFYDMMRWKPWAWEWWPSFKKIWNYMIILVHKEWMLQVAS